MGGHGSDYVRRTPISSYEEVLSEGVLCACCISLLPPGKRGYHLCGWNSDIGKCFLSMNSLQAELTQIQGIEDKTFKLCSKCHEILDKIATFKKKTAETFNHLGESTLENIRHGVRYYDLDLRSDGKPWKDCVCVACLCCSRQLSTTSSLRIHQTKGLCRDGCAECPKEPRAEHDCPAKASSSKIATNPIQQLNQDEQTKQGSSKVNIPEKSNVSIQVAKFNSQESDLASEKRNQPNNESNQSDQVGKESDKEKVPIRDGNCIENNDSKASNKVVEGNNSDNTKHNNKSSGFPRTEESNKNKRTLDDHHRHTHPSETIKRKEENKTNDRSKSENQALNQFNESGKEGGLKLTSTGRQKETIHQSYGYDKDKLIQKNLPDDLSKEKQGHSTQKGLSKEINKESNVDKNPSDNSNKINNEHKIQSSGLKKCDKNTLLKSSRLEKFQNKIKEREELMKSKRKPIIPLNYPNSWWPAIQMPWNRVIIQSDIEIIPKTTLKMNENNFINYDISKTTEKVNVVGPLSTDNNNSFSKNLKEMKNTLNAIIFLNKEKSKNSDTENNSKLGSVTSNKSLILQSTSGANKICDHNTEPNAHETLFIQNSDPAVLIPERTENIGHHNIVQKYMHSVCRNDKNEKSQIEKTQNDGDLNETKTSDRDDTTITDSQLERNLECIVGQSPLPNFVLSQECSTSSTMLKLLDEATLRDGSKIIDNLCGQARNHDAERSSASKRRRTSHSSEVTIIKRQRIIITDTESKQESDSSVENNNMKLRLESEESNASSIDSSENPITTEKSNEQNILLVDPEEKIEPVRADSASTDKTEVINKYINEIERMSDDIIILSSDDDNSCDTLVKEPIDLESIKELEVGKKNPTNIDGSDELKIKFNIQTETAPGLICAQESDLPEPIVIKIETYSHEKNKRSHKIVKRSQRSKSCGQITPPPRIAVRRLSEFPNLRCSYINNNCHKTDQPKTINTKEENKTNVSSESQNHALSQYIESRKEMGKELPSPGRKNEKPESSQSYGYEKDKLIKKILPGDVSMETDCELIQPKQGNSRQEKILKEINKESEIDKNPSDKSIKVNNEHNIFDNNLCKNDEGIQSNKSRKGNEITLFKISRHDQFKNKIKARKELIKLKKKSIIPLNYPHSWWPAIQMPWNRVVIQSDINIVAKTLKNIINNLISYDIYKTTEEVNEVGPLSTVQNNSSSSKPKSVPSNKSIILQLSSDANKTCDLNTEPNSHETLFIQNSDPVVNLPEIIENIGHSVYRRNNNERSQIEQTQNDGDFNETKTKERDDTTITDSQLESNLECIVEHSPLPNVVNSQECSTSSTMLKLLNEAPALRDASKIIDSLCGQARNYDTERSSASKRRRNSSQLSERTIKKRQRIKITDTKSKQESDYPEVNNNMEQRLEFEESNATRDSSENPIITENSDTQNILLLNPEEKLEPVRADSASTEKKEVINKNMNEAESISDDVIILSSDDDNSCDTFVYEPIDLESIEDLESGMENPTDIDGSDENKMKFFINTEVIPGLNTAQESGPDQPIVIKVETFSKENNKRTAKIVKRSERSKSCGQFTPSPRIAVRRLSNLRSTEHEESSSHSVAPQHISHPSMLPTVPTHLPLQPQLSFSHLVRPPSTQQHQQLSSKPSQSPQQHLQSCSKPPMQNSQPIQLPKQIPSEDLQATSQHQPTLRSYIKNWSSDDRLQSAQNSEQWSQHLQLPSQHQQQLLQQPRLLNQHATLPPHASNLHLQSQRLHCQPEPSFLQRVPQNVVQSSPKRLEPHPQFLSQYPQLQSRHQHLRSQLPQLSPQYQRLASTHPPQPSKHPQVSSKNQHLRSQLLQQPQLSPQYQRSPSIHAPQSSRHPPMESETHLFQFEGLATDMATIQMGQRRLSVQKPCQSWPTHRRTSVDRSASTMPYGNRSPGHIANGTSNARIPIVYSQARASEALNKTQMNRRINDTNLPYNSSSQSLRPHIGLPANDPQISESNRSHSSNGSLDAFIEFFNSQEKK